jgi:hypothetical protein
LLNPYGLFGIVLFVISTGYTVWLWQEQKNYNYPAPVWVHALGTLLLLFLLAVTSDLFVRAVDISIVVTQSSPKGGMGIDRAMTSPSILGLELLVERWHLFGVDTRQSWILSEQFAILQSVVEENYHNQSKVRLLKYFSGAKPRGGAFLMQADDQIPRVLKFDSLTNIDRELQRYREHVAPHLNFTPGEPLKPKQQFTKMEGQTWGAITYKFIGGDNLQVKQLQTFSEFFRDHDAARVISVLDQLFATLKPWWGMPVNDKVVGYNTRNSDLYIEYKRIETKYQQALSGVIAAEQALGDKFGGGLSSYQTEIDLGSGLSCMNPFSWITTRFQVRQLAWMDELRLRHDSLVHGDFHPGNLLISAAANGSVTTWIIDFPHVHVGPTVQDIARLEAEIKFSLIADDVLRGLDLRGLYELETLLLPTTTRSFPTLQDITPNNWRTLETVSPELDKVWQVVAVLRRTAKQYMNGNDARPYYLALLHATLPTLYFRDRTPWQKLYAFVSSAVLCERLG